LRLSVATSRPSALDGVARASLRYAPGAGEALLAALDAVLADPAAPRLDELAGAAGAEPEQVRALAAALRAAGGDAVIVYGERLLSGERADHVARALLNVAERVALAAHDGGGLLELPDGANHRGLREAACCRTPAPATPSRRPPAATPARSRRRWSPASCTRSTCSRSIP